MSTTYPYLGQPGAMTLMPGPNGTFDNAGSRHETVHTLINGGTAVTKRLHSKKTYTVPYTSRPGTNLDDILASFYEGLFGDNTLVLVDPSVRNVLGLDTSTMGVRPGSSSEWKPSAGTVLLATNTPPTGVTSGVLNWNGLAASATLMPGPSVATANTAKAPVYLPNEAHTISVYLMASSAATVTLRAAGCDVNGAVTVTSTSTSASLTTSWQRFSVNVPAGSGTYAAVYYLLPQILLGGTVPTNVYLAGAQVEYATSVSAFQRGYGSPRVLITQGPGRSIEKYGWSAHTLTLAEV